MTSTSAKNLLDLQNYRFHTCIGKSCDGAADVYSARCTLRGNADNALAIRIVPLDDIRINVDDMQYEVLKLRKLQHSNVMSMNASFVTGNALFMVFPLMDYGSVTDMMRARFMFGLPEQAIIHILRDLLQAVNYIHQRDLIHRAVRASHVFVSSLGIARLGGLRHSVTAIGHHGKRGQARHDITHLAVNGLLWLAPEILKQDLHGYSSKSDIYSVGITACEMANGFPPFADMEHMQMLYEKLRGTSPRLLDMTTLPADEQTHCEQRKRCFSAAFHEFTELCLKSDVNERWCGVSLLDHPFIRQLKKSRSQQNVNWTGLLEGLKPLTVPAVSTKYEVPTPVQPYLLNSNDSNQNDNKEAEWTF